MHLSAAAARVAAVEGGSRSAAPLMHLDEVRRPDKEDSVQRGIQKVLRRLTELARQGDEAAFIESADFAVRMLEHGAGRRSVFVKWLASVSRTSSRVVNLARGLIEIIEKSEGAPIRLVPRPKRLRYMHAINAAVVSSLNDGALP